MKLEQIKQPYLFYIGNAYPHKNLKRLVAAFNIMIQENQKIQLVLVGKMDYFYNNLKKFVQDLRIDQRVIFTGYVSDKELSWLYSNALLYVFPSLEEGFGLPGLEAMAKNLPVVCSNKAPLPEIYESAAVYFNPDNIKDMAEVILKVVNDDSLKQELKKQGREQIKKYSWEKCARETLNVYNKVILD